MLYLVKTADYYKIGYSKKDSLKTRLRTYTTHNPLVELIGIKEGTLDDENEYHLLFSQYEGTGEWFKVPEDIIDTIKSDFNSSDILVLPEKRGKRNKTKYSYTRNRGGILQYDADGNFLNRFLSIQDASDQTGISYWRIWNVLKGKRKTVGKYIWKEEK